MRFGFVEKWRGVPLSIAIGSCGSFALGALPTSTAQADHPPVYHHHAEIHDAEIHAAGHAPAGADRWDWLVPDRIERIWGIGWGDGYHACPEGCPGRPTRAIPHHHVTATRGSGHATKRINPLVRWFVHPWRNKEGADVGGAATGRVKSGYTEIDGVQINASGAIAAFHAPAWHGDPSLLAPTESVLEPAAPISPSLIPESVDAPLPVPALNPAELPPEAALDECELPAAVEQTYLFDPHPQPTLSDESLPIRGTLLAPLVRPAPLPSVAESPRPHRLPNDSVAPRTARALAPTTR